MLQGGEITHHSWKFTAESWKSFGHQEWPFHSITPQISQSMNATGLGSIWETEFWELWFGS